jgi:hypothetical protein
MEYSDKGITKRQGSIPNADCSHANADGSHANADGLTSAARHQKGGR